MSLLSIFQRHRELLLNLTARELKLRYRGSLLGFLWSVLIPLFMALIYLVFLRLLGGRGIDVADVIIGVFAWQFTVQCVNVGLVSVTGNANLVKKVYFPRAILPLSVTLANAVTYLTSLTVQLPLLAVLYYWTGRSFDAWALLLPIVLLFHTALNLGLALLLSAVNVLVRDAQQVAGLILTAWFFLSPVMYTTDFVARHAGAYGRLVEWFMLNPMAVVITGYRACLSSDVAFPWGLVPIASIGLSLVFLFVSYAVFQKLQRDFADWL